jgi:hypothetical protein
MAIKAHLFANLELAAGLQSVAASRLLLQKPLLLLIINSILNTSNMLPLLCAAEYLGGAVTCDAHHMTDPRADGLGVSTCINLALKDAGIEREQINYINAHATR